MSITINGATNTLTAASGLTIAGNTAVTGTLSATVQITTSSTADASTSVFAGNSASMAVAGGLAVAKAIACGSQISGTTLVATNALGGLALTNATYGNIVSTNTLYVDTTAGDINIRPGGVSVGSFSSTGLAVIGTLSSTGVITATLGISSGSDYRLTGAANGMYNSAVTDGSVYVYSDGGAGTGAVFYGSTHATKAGTIELKAATAVRATLSSTALTLGTGVNLNIKRAQAILADGTDGYLVYGSSTTSTTGATLVMYGETHVGTPNEAQFRVNNTTKMTVATSAVTLAAGVNLVMASGQGIDFSATGNGNGTNIVEVLSDYEEGDFVPNLNAFTVTGTYTVTGKYMKVGRQVTVLIKLVVDTGTIACVAGTSYFGLLPFTCGSISSAIGGVVDEATFIPLAGAYVPAGFTQLYPSAWAADANTRVISASYFV
jgi:hypothetical protein